MNPTLIQVTTLNYSVWTKIEHVALPFDGNAGVLVTNLLLRKLPAEGSETIGRR